jgi:glucose-6-phosphate 1-dehydrogenase
VSLSPALFFCHGLGYTFTRPKTTPSNWTFCFIPSDAYLLLLQESLVIVVFGASGDLAKNKTYPALFQLWLSRLLPPSTVIWGYARTKKTHEGLRQHLAPTLQRLSNHEESMQAFLSLCFYHSGKSYEDRRAFQVMMELILQQQQQHQSTLLRMTNFLFYLAIPPDFFGETTKTVRQIMDGTTMVRDCKVGWTRLVVEKPFGRDLASCQELLQTLGQNFYEKQVYRIDHYLGKEIVQNLPVFRKANQWIGPFFHKSTVQSVLITCQEPFGTEGRGGYFDQYGIIRDIIQNHLLQVLTLVAMEVPALDTSDNHSQGDDGGTAIRNAKAQVLRCIPSVRLEDTLLGQYEGYADDPSIANPGTRCPTYAAVRCWVQNERWQDVPFILEAGKALNQRVCEVRIQLKQSRVQSRATRSVPNVLVFRIQPDPAIYLTAHIKAPGLTDECTPATLALKYQDLDAETANGANIDAYTRLMLDVLRGRSDHFVRDDELVHSWQIFTPLLHKIDFDDGIIPAQYSYGSSGPAQRAEFLARMRQVATSGVKMQRDDILDYRGVLHSAL